jgi:hypothetical protein
VCGSLSKHANAARPIRTVGGAWCEAVLPTAAPVAPIASTATKSMGSPVARADGTSNLCRVASKKIEERVRAMCLALPGVTEKSSHGAPSFFAGKQFLSIWLDGHHDNHFPHLWCAAPPGAQDELVTTEPDRFFRPPYVGSRGWLGVRLDEAVDWTELQHVCEEAFRTVAPKKLLAELDERQAR